MTHHSIVHINKDFSNISEFIDSLFSPNVRSSHAVRSAVVNKKLHMFFSPSDCEKILNVWLAAWKNAQGDEYIEADLKHCPNSDRKFFEVLSRYLADNKLVMNIPSVTYTGDSTDKGIPIYELNTEGGYQRMTFQNQQSQTDYATVKHFLKLFLCGGHFVCIQSDKDLPKGTIVNPFYTYLQNSILKNNIRWNPSNSHYTQSSNRYGQYYPSNQYNFAPTPSPFILSFLACPTNSGPTDPQHAENTACTNNYSTFCQLEGWQAPFSRHHVDYRIAKSFLWNISAFGSCVYSEKRATTIFLAPPNWKPKFNPQTYMAPYVGARSIQPWLDTDAVRLS